MENIVNLTGCALSPDCGFNGAYQPPVNGEFFVSVAFLIKSTSFQYSIFFLFAVLFVRK